jgi:hypothetical protein
MGSGSGIECQNCGYGFFARTGVGMSYSSLKVLAILTNRLSMIFFHEPWFGVKTKSIRLASYLIHFNLGVCKPN